GQFRMGLSRLSYRFGFLIRRSGRSVDLSAVSDWPVIHLDGFVVHMHPEVGVRTVSTKDGTALLIGEAFVARGTSTVEAVLLPMAELGVWDTLDDISGRFALLLISKGECRVVHDPIGSRSVY